MSKKNKRKKTAASRSSKTAAAPVSATPSNKSAPNMAWLNRRNAIKLLIGLPIAGAVGATIHRHDVQNRGLHDLSLIGQGQSVVVQIHDPACQLCRRLMKNTREALDGNENVLFKVADVTTADGEAFRRKYHGETVSLMLFDGKGRPVNTIKGVQTAEHLKGLFSEL